MLKLRIFSAGLVVCLLATMSSVAMAEMISNGDFEAVTGSTFDDWSTASVDAAYTVATDPMNIDGINSARIIAYGKGVGDYNDAGTLKQQFSVDGMSDFQIEFDFAFLDCGSDEREFALFTYAADGTTIVDNMAIKKSLASGNHFLRYYGTTATQASRDWRVDVNNLQYGDVTPDINTLKSFDGETPVANHLTLVGTGYGTEDYSLTITLNDDSTWVLTDHIRDANQAISTIAFLGRSGSVDSDFIVDNVSITAIPEPSTIVLLLAIFASLALVRRV